MDEHNNSKEEVDENGNDSQPAPCVPKDKEHSRCIEEILSLENLFFSAPPATKDEFEIIKMHTGDINQNYARIFFEFNKDCSDEDIRNVKRALGSVKNDCGVIDDKKILKNVKRVVVDRSKIDGYSKGEANDKIIFNEDNELISVRFVKKPEDDQIAGEGLSGNAVYNKVMVLKYDNKITQKQQEFIVDMDNNLIITTDNLKLYWHSKDNGTGFDDNKTPVYISSSEAVPMYNHFRINNAIKFENEDDFYQQAMKRLGNNKLLYGINYIYTDQCCKETSCNPIEDAQKWATNVITFVKSQVAQFNNIIQDKLNIEEKKRKIQTFCNSFKDYLLGHKKNDDCADKEDNKKYDNIIMINDIHYGDVDGLLSYCKVRNEEEKQKQVENIIYSVFEQITKFIKKIKEEVKKIEEPSTTQQYPSNNYAKIKMETEGQETKCGCSCDFGLPDCLKNFLGK